jgi:hypothetical protein
MAAGTIVLRERTSAGRGIAVSFPPPVGFEAYVASLDVSPITPTQYSVIRSFLMRVFELSPAARMALAIRLANPTATLMHHTPPPTVSPEMFLACVAAAYQRRYGGPAMAQPSGFAGFAPPPAPPPPPPAWRGVS